MNKIGLNPQNISDSYTEVLDSCNSHCMMKITKIQHQFKFKSDNLMNLHCMSEHWGVEYSGALYYIFGFVLAWH